MLGVAMRLSVISLLALFIASSICFVLVVNLRPRIKMPYEVTILKGEAIEIASRFLRESNFREITREAEVYAIFQDNSTFIAFYYNYTLRLGYSFDIPLEELPVKYWLVKLISSAGEVVVGVDAYTGRIVYLSVWLSDSEYGRNLRWSEAYEKAVFFLEKLGYRNVSSWRLVLNETRVEENFTEHCMEWIKTSYRLETEGALEERVSMRIIGSTIIYYEHYVKVPRNFVTGFKEEYFSMLLLLIPALIVNLFLFVASIVLFAKNYKVLKPRLAVFGILTLIVITLMLALNILSVDEVVFEVPKEVPKQVFLAVKVLMLIFSAIFQGIFFFTESSTAYVLEDKVRTRWVVLGRLVEREQIDVKKSLSNVAVGYIIAFILFLISVSYFIVLEILVKPIYSSFAFFREILSSGNVIVSVFIISSLAAVFEEIVFRAFSINLFKKLFRRELLAVLVSSALWSLLHLNYPIIPRWIKVGQILIQGVILGYIYLTWGLETTIVSHYVFNILSLISVFKYLPVQSAAYFFVLLAIPGILVCLITLIHNKYLAKPPAPVVEDIALKTIQEYLEAARLLLAERLTGPAFTLASTAYLLLVSKVVGSKDILSLEESWKRLRTTDFYAVHSLSFDLVRALVLKYWGKPTTLCLSEDVKELINELKRLVNAYIKTAFPTKNFK